MAGTVADHPAPDWNDPLGTPEKKAGLGGWIRGLIPFGGDETDQASKIDPPKIDTPKIEDINPVPTLRPWALDLFGGAVEKAEGVAKEAVARQVPGYGVLFTADGGTFKPTPLGWGVGAGVAYFLFLRK